MMHQYKATHASARRENDALPFHWILSDPARNADIVGLASAIPSGSGLIYRHFGATDRFMQAERAAHICRVRDVVFLVSLDAALAMACGADGMHVPQKYMQQTPALRRLHPRLLFTVASHDARAARRAFHLGADAVLLSPVFPSRSPSAGEPLGLCRTLLAARSLPGPVIALGGITQRDFATMHDHGIRVATVSGQRKPAKIRT